MRALGWIVLILALCAVAVCGLALRGSELLNPWSGSAEGHRMRAETDRMQRQGEIDLQAYEAQVEAARKQAEIDLRAYEALKAAELQRSQAEWEQELRMRELWIKAGIYLLQFAGSVLLAVLAALLCLWLWERIRPQEPKARPAADRAAMRIAPVRSQEEGQSPAEAIARARFERHERLREGALAVGAGADNNGHSSKAVINFDSKRRQGGTRS